MPDENGLLSTHLIALDALMSVVHEIESRGSGQPHPIAVFDSLPEHPEDEPRQLVPPHYAAKKSNQPALPSAAEVADIKKRKLLLAEGEERRGGGVKRLSKNISSSLIFA